MMNRLTTLRAPLTELNILTTLIRLSWLTLRSIGCPDPFQSAGGLIERPRALVSDGQGVLENVLQRHPRDGLVLAGLAVHERLQGLEALVVVGQVVLDLVDVNAMALADRVGLGGRGALRRHRCWPGGMTELTERCESLAEQANAFVTVGTETAADAIDDGCLG